MVENSFDFEESVALPGSPFQGRRFLIVDDDVEMVSLLSDFVSAEGGGVRGFASPAQGLQFLRENPSAPVDLVITDLNMPGMNGMEFTRSVKEIRNSLPVVLITAFGSIETAIEAIRAGAYDYVTKPFRLDELKLTLMRGLELNRLRQENQVLRTEVRKSQAFAGIIGKSPAMIEVFDLVKRVAPATANVLIVGESGTGKEQVARAIHSTGPRAQKPFVAINCTAIPETLLESELFGHAKGSFTGAIQRKRGLFEEAEGGTLFLDEIGDMDVALQAKLLRVLQERRIRAVGDTSDREINVRVIAATHKDLKVSIRNGTFREDLYYRLSVIPIVIPPLRHRKEDIPLLADHFIRKFASNQGSSVVGLTKAALQYLINMPWEGNVRELENVMERAVVLARGDMIEPGDLPSLSTMTTEDLWSSFSQQLPTLEEIERRYIRFVLEKTGGKKEKAAQILGCNRRTLYRKEREYGFVTEPPGGSEFDELELDGPAH